MSGPSAVVDGTMVYFNPRHSHAVFACNAEKLDQQIWYTLPQCPRKCSSLAVVGGDLTTVGGLMDWEVTGQLFSLTGERKWEEHFPPLPTKRYNAAVVCRGNSLVVAGGETEGSSELDTVEVMDTETLQWSTASSLPFAFPNVAATVCEDRVYMVGYTKAVLACSLTDLLQSNLQTVWYQVARLPVRSATCASLCGPLLAVGGINDAKNRTTAVHQYNPVTNSWEVISHMSVARSSSLVAVLPGHKLMVVGGWINRTDETDMVEIAELL